MASPAAAPAGPAASAPAPETRSDGARPDPAEPPPEFPGCRAVRITRAALDDYEGRFESASHGLSRAAPIACRTHHARTTTRGSAHSAARRVRRGMRKDGRRGMRKDVRRRGRKDGPRWFASFCGAEASPLPSAWPRGLYEKTPPHSRPRRWSVATRRTCWPAWKRGGAEAVPDRDRPPGTKNPLLRHLLGQSLRSLPREAQAGLVELVKLVEPAGAASACRAGQVGRPRRV